MAKDLEGKVPPQNLDAERSVLGSMLLLSEAIDDVSDLVTADHFYGDAHRLMYSAIIALHERGIRGIDVVTLGEELERQGELANAGGPEYLTQVLESVPHAAHAKYYAGIVRDKAVQRKLIYACTDILRDSYSGSIPTDELLGKAEQGIFRILQDREKTDRMAISEILMETFERINARWEQGGDISGLSTGFSDLNAQTNGFQGSELIILAARPSMGKTAFVCNVAEHVASEENVGVVIFSLEQSKLELAERFLCIRSGVNGHALRSGELSDEDKNRLMQASSELNSVPLFIDDSPGRTMAQIGAICRRLARRNQLGLVIIDYLQLIEPEEKGAPREQQIAQITRRLKALSKELDIPLIALAQLNRGVELREDKRPRLADLRESGAIEQDADLVMFLHRPDAYNPEDNPGLAEVIVAKHRSGPTGMVHLTWLKESMRFVDYSNAMVPDDMHFGSDSRGF